MSEASRQRRTMRRNIKEMPAAAWVLVVGNFINWFASFASAFLVLYLRSRGYSLAESGTGVATYGMGALVAGPLAGQLADRLGRRNTMVFSMAASAVTTMALWFVDAYSGILALAFLAGVTTETWRPASRALMADMVPEGQRVTAFALVRFAGNLGFAIGGAVAGFLADRSFFWVFALDASTSLIFAVLALSLLPHGRRTSRSEDVERGGFSGILADRGFLLFLLSSVLVAFVYAQEASTLPLYVRNIGLSNSAFGLMLSLNGLLVVALELPISSWTMHQPPRQMIAAGFLLVGLGFALTAVAGNLPALLATVGIWTAGEMIGAPVSYAYVSDVAPEHLRGRYQGTYELAWGIGGVAGPAVGTLILAFAPTGFWLVCGALGLVSGVLALSAKPRTLAATAGREANPPGAIGPTGTVRRAR